MKFRFVIVAAAGFALVACGGQTKPVPEKSEASTSTSASSTTSSTVATSPAASGKGDTPTRDFVVGKWGTNGDCELAIELRADGTSDGPFGKWSYNDGVISFDEEPDFKVNVTVIDDNTMESTNDGKTSKMTRCP